MRRLLLVAAWVGTTLAVTTAAWAVVSAVDDQVSDRPLTPLVASTTLVAGGSTTTALPPVSDPSAETTLPLPTTDTGEGPTTTLEEVTTTTSAGPTTTSHAPSEPPTTTPTTSSGSTTTTTVTTTTTSAGGEGTTTTTVTTNAGTWETKTVPTDGGTVVVSYRPDEVVLDAATASVGWTVRIELTGPPEVRVEFETDDGHSKIDVRIRYKDGALDVDVNEETES